MHLIQKRIFVGNLPPRLSQSALEKKLREFGNVLSVEMKQRTDNEGNTLSSFAFVEIETDSEKLKLCFRRFENELWGNHKIKLEVAKESFLERLKREQNLTSPTQNLASNPNNTVDSKCNTNKQSNSVQKIPDRDNTRGPVSCDGRRHSCFSKNSIATEQTTKNSKSKINKARANDLQSDEMGTCGVDKCSERSTGYKREESGKFLNDGDSDTKTSIERSGSLPMFSGTKTFLDMEDNGINKTVPLNQSCVQKEKSKLHSICSPDKKPHVKHDSCYTTEETTRKKNEQAIYSSTVSSAGPPNVCEKRMNISEMRSGKNPKNDLAEEKRLNALEERKKAFALQKEVVKKALSAVDLKSTSNKKIVFELDEDDEGPVAFHEENNFPHYTNDEAPKHKLFGDSSDDEAMNDVEVEDFKIKPQFEGWKGQKLLAIQSRFANDSRFNLDKRFLESDDEEECGLDEREGEDLNAEKNHQLSILQGILGVDVSIRTAKKDRMDNRVHMEMIRFDPSNPEHSRFLMKEEESEKKKKGKEVVKEGEGGGGRVKKGEREEEEELLPTSKERFYVVSDLLRESLKRRTKQSGVVEDGGEQEKSIKGFSLLEAFGSTPSDNEEEDVAYDPKVIKRDSFGWEKNPFRYDSSDEEEDDTNICEDKGETSLLNCTGMPENTHTSTSFIERFHFKNNDPRLQEGLEFFGVKESFGEMQEEFHEKRAVLKLIIKAKVRNNKRKNQPLKKKLGGARRFKKNLALRGRK